MREKELRLALVCYGGVSLAVYMHGIVKEVWKLLRASRAFHAEGRSAEELSDSERVWFDLLAALEPSLSLRVIVDIVAGASAGGINGVQLAHAISGGHDMEPLRDMWLDHADVERLLDPVATPSSALTKLYARPLVWFMQRGGGDDMDGIDEPAVRYEVSAKLTRFVRSRWFEPPFSGPNFTRVIHESLRSMETGRGAPLLPPQQLLDLHVTVTDFSGTPERLRLNSPEEVVETEHRLVIGFRDPGGAARSLGSRASLTFAARATASFPGAFPPFQGRELDGVLAADGGGWPDRDSFLARVFPRRAAAGLDPARATLIDGSVLNNRPFGPAIEALRHRPAHREVDRRFVYIDPKPGGHLLGVHVQPGEGTPGFFRTIFRALSDIPREQPIRDSVAALTALSERVRRLRRIVEGMRGEVDRAIERATGTTLKLFSVTPERMTEWRGRVQTAAAKEAGFAYPAYALLKLGQVVDAAAAMSGAAERMREAIGAWVRATGTDRIGGPGAFVAFLKRFDLDYRVRRLRFLIRRVNELGGEAADDERAALDRAKAGLYRLLAPFEARRGDAPPARPRETADAWLDRLAAALDLTALDAATDGPLLDLLNDPAIENGHRRQLLNAWLGFPFFDIATLPLLQGEGVDEFDEIKVDRISPDDAKALVGGGAAATLKGLRFNAFGAFFSRAWRENDYLWGRLHAADRLIDIVTSAAPEGALGPGVAAKLKQAAFRAILTAERPHLTKVPELFAKLEAMAGA